MDYFPTAPLAESSKKMLNTSIRKWVEVIGHRSTVMTIVKYPEVCMNHLRGCETIKDTPTNRHHFIYAITAYIQHEMKGHKDQEKYLEVWKQRMRENSEPITARAFTGEPTERQKTMMTDWETICKVRDDLPMTSTKILLAMYTYIPPQRGGDFHDCKVYMKDPETTEGNYLVLEPGKERLVMNEYKTERKYGQNRIRLPEPLVKLLNEYWDKHKNEHNALFIKSEKNEPYDRKAFSGWANKRLAEAFGRPMTLTVIRHTYVSSQDFNKCMIDLKTTASAMSHSMGTQQLYRWDKK